jgi:hypothetical protein
MMMHHVDSATERVVVDHAAAFGVEIDAVGTIREGLPLLRTPSSAFFTLSI